MTLWELQKEIKQKGTKGNAFSGISWKRKKTISGVKELLEVITEVFH